MRAADQSVTRQEELGRRDDSRGIREKQNWGGRVRRAVKRALLVCSDCRNPVEPGHGRCQVHLDYYKEKAKQHNSEKYRTRTVPDVCSPS